MNNRNAASTKPPTAQEVCIDLPGEVVQCWRSSDKVKVILRKHRDVIFDININPGATYTVESGLDFYSSRDKKLLKLAHFQDGERFHIWIGRNFKGRLVLKSGNSIMGSYDANKLDQKEYDTNPKTKPEPLMVIFGKTKNTSVFSCPADDPDWWKDAQKIFKPMYDPIVSALKGYGTQYDYQYPQQLTEVQEYVAITEAMANEIHSQVLKQLNDQTAVKGTVREIFKPPTENSAESDLYKAIGVALAFISGDSFFASNTFKESAGYLKENWKALDMILMRVHIEKNPIGKYRVAFKGRRLIKVAAQLLGGATAMVAPKTFALGSKESAFLDGGIKKTGRTGLAGVKRILLTISENFRAGAKIQGIGTVLDIIGDAKTVYFNKAGSDDFSEFLARVGVSLIKAAVTAAIGGLIAALIMTLVGVVVAGAPVWATALAVIGGFILAATLVDQIDSSLNLKESFADWAR